MRVMDQFTADVRDLFEKLIIAGTSTNLVVYSFFFLYFYQGATMEFKYTCTITYS